MNRKVVLAGALSGLACLVWLWTDGMWMLVSCISFALVALLEWEEST